MYRKIIYIHTMCRAVTVVMLEPLNLLALIIAFWFQSDQYSESSNVDMLNGWGSQMVLNRTRRLWLPSKLHDDMVCSLASTQYSLPDTRSRVMPFGHFTSNEAITWRCVPSMPARSIFALLPQSLQYNHLPENVFIFYYQSIWCDGKIWAALAFCFSADEGEV